MTPTSPRPDPTRRPDLLALTDDALAALANRGLLKRAAKDLAASAPTLDIDGTRTVTADFTDGTHVRLGSGGLEAGVCSCSASGVCRHLVETVLAVRALGEASDADDHERDQPWSPAQVDDEELLQAVGRRALESARRKARAGLRATVYLPNPAQPPTGENAAAVDLPTTTVRFLVPGDLGYAHTDVVATERAEQVALAVLAFREARSSAPRTSADDVGQAQLPGPAKVEVVLGRQREVTDLETPLEPALGLVTDLVEQGVRLLAGHIGPRVAAARVHLTERGMQWPLDSLDDLAHQLDAYADGHAGYARKTIAELAAEIAARAAATRANPTDAEQILGTRQPARTAMRRARFVGLGARVIRKDSPAGDSANLTTRVYLADVDAGRVLVLSTSSTHQADQIPAPEALARRRVGGIRVGEMARGSLTTESASRTAGLRLHLSAGGTGRSTVMTGPSVWDAVPDQIVIERAEDAVRELMDRPFRLVAPRFAAPSVRLLRVARVLDLGYHAGSQMLTAQLADAVGTPITMSCAYRTAAPGALDAIASVLGEAAQNGGGLELSGVLSLSRGQLTIDPLALGTAQGIVVPDLQPVAGMTPGREDRTTGDALDQVLNTVGAFLAETLHTGLNGTTGAYAQRVDRLAAELEAIGFNDLARALRALRSPTATSWLDAQVLYLATVDSL